MARPYISVTVRALVYERADGRCEYCLISEEDTPQRHALDHIIPLKHQGKTEADNLALACVSCNQAKGSDLGAEDPISGELMRFFNPRRDQWREHFIIEGEYVIGITAAGRATVQLLRMNTSRRLKERKQLQAINAYPLK